MNGICAIFLQHIVSPSKISIPYYIKEISLPYYKVREKETENGQMGQHQEHNNVFSVGRLVHWKFNDKDSTFIQMRLS